MLKELRYKKTAQKIWIILAVLIVPAFVFWGFGQSFKSREGSQYAGRIFGKKISLLEYRDAFQAVKNQAIIQFQENFSEIEKHLNLESQAWERLLLLYEAKRRKIKASDEEVIKLIKSYPFFQKKGRFDNRTYTEILRYVFRTQPRVFEEETRQNIILSKLYKEVTDNVVLSEEEIREAYRKENEEISIDYLCANPLDFIKEITAIAEEELKDFFVKNKLDFKQPLSFNVEYISSDAEEKIKKLILKINKRDGFSKVAKDPKVSIKETGFFSQTDSIPGIGWSPAVIGLISKLNVGEISLPIKIDKTYYIFRLKERKDPYIPDYESIKERIKEEFIKKKSYAIAKEKISACLKKIREIPMETIDFNQLAKEFGLKSGTTKEFKYASYIEGIGASDNFWRIAQNLKDNETSEIIEVEGTGLYLIKRKNRIPFDEKKFETEKDEFMKWLLMQKKQEYFAKFIEELKRKNQAF
ncbi:MAG: peptidylprolyl isomerase [Candidatus Omnitrophica bacterium]|nr:peptidylprolyl isomerase [Candidatus Omnitrophota bacterium]